MKSPVLWILLLTLGSGTLAAQEEPSNPAAAYRSAAASVSADLREALEELNQVRTGISGEKPALAKEANRIASELREARRQAEIARTRSDAIEEEFAKTEAELKSWRDEKIYLESLLLDFRKTFESSQPLQNLAPLAPVDLESNLALLEKSMEVLTSAGRIASEPGEAVGESGVLAPGTFVQAGPVQWFLPEDKSDAGVVTSGDDLRPGWLAGSTSNKALESLLAGKSAVLSFDPTLGSAISLTETRSTLLDHVRQGGFWIYPILLLAVIALAAALAKWIQLFKIRALSPNRVQDIVRLASTGEHHEALNELAQVPHPAARVLSRGIQIFGKDPSKRANRDDLEEAMFERFLEEQPRLQRGLPLIAIASATAPLLGLLGTVTGMIETFRLINIFGTGDAKTLASGISEALVTTEFGLIVAIPALILHALLSRKVQGIKATMEMASLAFLNGITSPEPPEPLKPVA